MNIRHRIESILTYVQGHTECKFDIEQIDLRCVSVEETVFRCITKSKPLHTARTHTSLVFDSLKLVMTGKCSYDDLLSPQAFIIDASEDQIENVSVSDGDVVCQFLFKGWDRHSEHVVVRTFSYLHNHLYRVV